MNIYKASFYYYYYTFTMRKNAWEAFV